MSKVGVALNQSNIDFFLENNPIQSCEVQSNGWDTMSEMVDTIIVTMTGKTQKKAKFYESFKEKLFNKQVTSDDEEDNMGLEFDIEAVKSKEKDRYFE